MGDYLSKDELAKLVDCEPNQRAVMIRWLDKNRWKYQLDRHGMPKVSRVFHDRKLGVSNEQTKASLETTPNRNAFIPKSSMGSNTQHI